jgi:large subunit ribosomal protein L4
MEIAVLNSTGQETGRKVKLNSSLFGAEPNDHAIYLDVKQYMANQRQGTHKSKERNEIAGSTRKLKKQKGTGGARSGSIKSPLFVGGGRVFGPQPRDYSFKVNKKLKTIARISALSYKAMEQQIIIVENLGFDAPRTKQFVDLMSKLNLSDKKTLLVLEKSDKAVYLSSRNLKKSKVVTASDLNTYDVVNAQNLILMESSLPVIENTLLK